MRQQNTGLAESKTIDAVDIIEWLRPLADNSTVGIYVVQMGKFQFTNSIFRKLAGYSEKELMDMDSLSLVWPEDRNMVRKSAVEMLVGKRFSPYEFRYFSKSGESLWAMETVSSIYYQGRRATMGNFIDITERKRMEIKFRELYEQEAKLREGLETERGRRIEFTRLLVHELKTALTPMMAASQLLAEELQEGTLLRLSNSISRSASNLSNRIDELLDLVKGDAGMLHMEFKSVDPLSLLHRVADAIAPMALSKEHSLILDLPPSLPPIRADESRLQQVMLNLFNNASRFTPGGGEITIRARERDTALIVEIQDTGRGITDEAQQRLFEPYYQAESDRQYMSGMGLGLALCKALVERHGGRIWVESNLGEGSTFGFSIPLEKSLIKMEV